MTFANDGEHWKTRDGVHVVTYRFVNTRAMDPDAKATIKDEGVYHTRIKDGQERWLDKASRKKLLLLPIYVLFLCVCAQFQILADLDTELASPDCPCVWMRLMWVCWMSGVGVGVD